jgi:hypothetical protein
MLRCVHARVHVAVTVVRMKLVMVRMELEDKMEYPATSLNPGEHIVVRVVELAQLKDVFQGVCLLVHASRCE